MKKRILWNRILCIFVVISILIMPVFIHLAPINRNIDVNVEKLKTSLGSVWGGNGTIVCGEDDNQYSPEMCYDGAGGAIITWIDTSGSDHDIFAQRVNSAGTKLWAEAGVEVCTATDDQNYPKICSDGVGGAFIAWTDFRGGVDADAYISRIDSDGNLHSGWTANGMLVDSASDAQSWMNVICDGNENAILVWEDIILTGNDNIFGRKIYNDGSMGSKLSICTYTSNQNHPEICSDGNNGAIIAWYDYRVSETAIYAHRIDSSGSLASGWSTNGVLISDATEYQTSHRIVSDGSGGAFIAWKDNRVGASGYDIYASRIDSDGSIHSGWTSNGNAVCVSSNDQSYMEMCSDGSGGAIITWRDERTSESDIYAQRIDGNGDASWTTNGVALCKDSYGQASPAICSDGAGGAVVTWEDGRTGAQGAYAQQISASGSVVFAINGIPVTLRGTYVQSFEMIYDYSGGILIAWEDRNPNGDWDDNNIYAQRVVIVDPPTWFDLLINFILSPLGLIIIGGIAVVTIVIVLKKRR